jgi:pyridoxamine 5'-phosphate oxidase
MEHNPIEIFKQLFNEELKLSNAKIPSACCFSTNGLDGFPNARFVSLKDITDHCFIVTGSLTSRKGIEINHSEKVALTFWWTETEKQVRVQGIATKISNELADKYFFERNLDSQIVSIVSNQGAEIQKTEELVTAYENMETESKNKQLIRPNNWGGYLIEPIRIEFLEFKETRFHDRKLYENENWKVTKLQP